MKTKTLLAIVVLTLIVVSCSDSSKEKDLQLREEQLSKKEALFAQKQCDYEALQKMRDSLNSKNDSLMVKAWPDSIVGNWNAKTICTESNCSSYVIGDQRTDTWQFVNTPDGPKVTVLNNSDVVRMYNGTYKENEIDLSFKTDSTSQKQVEMNVVLNDFSNGKMKGTRTVTVDASCKANFSVELVPSKK